MADVALVCVREDAWKAELLADALGRYGFSVCRSASVFEDFQGYAAVVVLLSPGAARSELVMQTAARALDWGKLIPVFVNLCTLPDRLAGVALHDLSCWDGRGEDPVVRAIAYHAQRLSGGPGKPALGAAQPRPAAAPLALDSYAPEPAYIAPPARAYAPPPQAMPNYAYDYEAHHYHRAAYDGHDYGATRHEPAYTPPAPYFVAAAHNELHHAPVQSAFAPPVDVSVTPNNNDAAQRRAYFMERAAFMDAPRSPLDYAHEVTPDDEPPRQRRPMSSGLFTVLLSAVLLMGMAYVEEARTREVQLLRATPAEATVILTQPAAIDTADLPKHTFARR